MSTKTLEKPKNFQATQVSKDELADIIREHEFQRIFLNAKPNSFRKFPAYLRIDEKPYWDGVITNPNATHFDFNLFYGDDQQLVVLQYKHINGLLIPRKNGNKFIDPLVYSC